MNTTIRMTIPEIIDPIKRWANYLPWSNVEQLKEQVQHLSQLEPAVGFLRLRSIGTTELPVKGSRKYKQLEV